MSTNSLSAPPCAPLFGPRVSAVRRPFPPCFIYLYSLDTLDSKDIENSGAERCYNIPLHD
jgi:hypothetical protein